MKNKSTKWILASLLMGIISGLVFHWLLPADLRDSLVAVFDTVTHMFLNLIKMIIAPLIFATLVSGIAGAAKSAGVGKLFGRAMVWFLTASALVGAFGFIMAHVLNVGDGLHLVPTGGAALESHPLDFQAFITNIIPTSVFSALTTNNPLQILVFGALFGIALLNLRKKGRSSIADAIDELMKVMLKVTGYVMLAAPVGVFAGIASAFTAQGLDAFATYASFIGGFYLSLSALWVIMICVAAAFLGRAVFRLVRMVREPMVIAFATSSSEAALPKLIEGLTKFGIEKRTTGFVLPLGYSFNVDGSMMYMTFASVFLINTYGIDMDLGQQIAMTAMLLLSSKGMAGVPRGSLVVVAAVVPAFGIPAAGIAVLLVVDQLLDMGRTATNILGNAIATAVIGRKHDQDTIEADEFPAADADQNRVPAPAMH
ncbi:cation:dicarboxylase symporter family transporter [Pseudarthrobacter psychrotolerans]|uniref:Cation:dicarboxylase symporter family transporter n=1 Tax=Pseudarthrobacter psychrotolerans TaxID=2697569 RepID=A0A6P1NPG1_9MICC|nr:dicarboxylate/amino acid:cation symporter [Pseudarthrobacter psychrotolerans]QHK21098.1 cation:dicarboxylase symporter family transporter [Pseudarthrobacter psychrotolerans]